MRNIFRSTVKYVGMLVLTQFIAGCTRAGETQSLLSRARK